MSVHLLVFVRYHCLDDAVNGLCVYDGSALAQVHCHEVPPEDHPWRVGNLSHSHLIYVPGCCHGKYPNALFACPLCCHFDTPTWASSHVAICDDHSEAEGLGVRG